MHFICTWYVLDIELHLINLKCTRYALDMYSICTQYALDMHDMQFSTPWLDSIYFKSASESVWLSGVSPAPDDVAWEGSLASSVVTASSHSLGSDCSVKFRMCYYASQTETYIHNRIQIYIQIYVSDWYYMTICNHLGLGLILLWPISTLYMY